MRLDRHQIREEVPPTQREVLNDEVHCVVGVLYARDGYVANLTAWIQYINQCTQW